MARKLLVGAVMAGLFFVSATTALAHCPAGYMTTSTGSTHFDPKAAPPTYMPGNTVEVVGSRFEVPAGTEVTLRWGAAGEIVGRAAVSAEQTWHLSFAIPANLAFDSYFLTAVAYLPDGSLAPGLPSRLFLTIGNAPAATVQATVPTPAVPKTTATTKPVSAKPSTPAPKATVPSPKQTPIAVPPRNAKAQRPAAPKPASAPRSLVAPPAVAVPVKRAALAAKPRTTHPSRWLGEGARIRPATVLSAAPSDAADRPWLLLGFFGLALLIIGSASLAVLLARRRATVRDLLIEAELQELIAEERARARETVDSMR